MVSGMKKLFLSGLLATGFVAPSMFVASCSSDPEVRGNGPEYVGNATAPTRTRWSRYLQVMSDKERITFMEIEDDFDREQWIRREGIDVREELSRKLARGMSVAAAKSRMDGKPDEEIDRNDSTMLFYSAFNTRSRTNVYLKFDADSLTSWGSYTIEQQDRQRDLLNFESDLMRLFNRVLKRGMAPSTIRNTAKNAQEDVNRTRLANRDYLDNREEQDGALKHKSNTYDFVVEESLLLAEMRNDLYAWFRGREPDEVILHRPFETHRYKVDFKSRRGYEETVIVDFVYKSGMLEEWYVYHDE